MRSKYMRYFSQIFRKKKKFFYIVVDRAVFLFFFSFVLFSLPTHEYAFTHHKNTAQRVTNHVSTHTHSTTGI